MKACRGVGNSIESRNRPKSKAKAIVLFIDKSLCSFEIRNVMDLAIRNYPFRVNSLIPYFFLGDRVNLAIEYKKPKLFFERDRFTAFCNCIFNYFRIDFAKIKCWAIIQIEEMYYFVHALLVKRLPKSPVKSLVEGRDIIEKLEMSAIVEDIKNNEEEIVADHKDECVERLKFFENKSDLLAICYDKEMHESFQGDFLQIEEQHNQSDEEVEELHQDIGGDRIEEECKIESISKNDEQKAPKDFCEPDEISFQESDSIVNSEHLLNTEIVLKESDPSLINYIEHDRTGFEQQLRNDLMSETNTEEPYAKEIVEKVLNTSSDKSSSVIPEIDNKNRMLDFEEETCILNKVNNEDNIVNCNIIENAFLIIKSKPIVVAESIEKVSENKVKIEAKNACNISFDAVKEFEKEIERNKKILEELTEVKRQNNKMIQEMKMISTENKKLHSQKHLISLNKSVNEEAGSRRNLIEIAENISRGRMANLKNKIHQDHKKDIEKTIIKYINSTESSKYSSFERGSSYFTTKPHIDIQKNSSPKVQKYNFAKSTLPNNPKSKINSKKYNSSGFDELKSRTISSQSIGSLSLNGSSTFKHLPSGQRSDNIERFKPIQKNNRAAFTFVNNYHADATNVDFVRKGPELFHVILVGLLLIIYILI